MCRQDNGPCPLNFFGHIPKQTHTHTPTDLGSSHQPSLRLRLVAQQQHSTTVTLHHYSYSTLFSDAPRKKKVISPARFSSRCVMLNAATLSTHRVQCTVKSAQRTVHSIACVAAALHRVLAVRLVGELGKEGRKRERRSSFPRRSPVH